jgi:hypothetical protein
MRFQDGELVFDHPTSFTESDIDAKTGTADDQRLFGLPNEIA